MDLNDLSKLDIKDLKNVDWRKALDQFRSRPDLIVNALAVIITFFLCINFYSKRQNEIKNVKYEISMLEGKIGAIDEYDIIKAELDQYVANIPQPISEDQLINQITDYAVARNIQIQSFSPAKKQTQPLYDLTSIILKVTADDYANLWLFINDIEKSPYTMRVERWSGFMGPSAGTARPSRRRTDQSIETEDLVLNVEIEIASINIKNE